MAAKRRKKKKLTKKRLKRILKAYFFRLLFVLIILAVLFLGYTLVKFTVKGISSMIDQINISQEASAQKKAEAEKEKEEAEAASSMAEAAETETEHEPVITTLTLTATGDCTFAPTQNMDYDRSFHEYYDEKGADYFFEGIRSIFEQDDMTMVNLECVLSEATDAKQKEFLLKGKPEYTSIMTGSSVEVAYLGNNHSADYGPQSLLDTQNNLDQVGIVWAIDEQLGYYTTKDGIKVGIVSEEIVPYTQEKEQILLDGVAELKRNGCNLIIACCHWGAEKAHYIVSEQKKVVHDLIDAGADLIIGNHPHVLEGVEVYKGKVICYSLGNLCFGGNKNPSEKDSMLYQQTFTFVDGEVQLNIDANMIPIRISSESGYNDYHPIIATDRKQNIINDVNDYSRELGDTRFDENGDLIPPAEYAEESVAEDASGEKATGEEASEA